jgi:hypothetical protein
LKFRELIHFCKLTLVLVRVRFLGALRSFLWVLTIPLS